MHHAARCWYALAMNESAPDIIVATNRIDPKELARLTSTFFEDMVKYVVDIERDVAAVGGALYGLKLVWGLRK